MKDNRIENMKNILENQVEFWKKELEKSKENDDLIYHSYYCKGCLKEAELMLEFYEKVFYENKSN